MYTLKASYTFQRQEWTFAICLNPVWKAPTCSSSQTTRRTQNMFCSWVTVNHSQSLRNLWCLIKKDAPSPSARVISHSSHPFYWDNTVGFFSPISKHFLFKILVYFSRTSINKKLKHISRNRNTRFSSISIKKTNKQQLLSVTEEHVSNETEEIFVVKIYSLETWFSERSMTNTTQKL